MTAAGIGVMARMDCQDWSRSATGEGEAPAGEGRLEVEYFRATSRARTNSRSVSRVAETVA